MLPDLRSKRQVEGLPDDRQTRPTGGGRTGLAGRAARVDLDSEKPRPEGMGRVSTIRPRTVTVDGAADGQRRHICLVGGRYVGHPPRDNNPPTQHRPDDEAGEVEEKVLCSRKTEGHR